MAKKLFAGHFDKAAIQRAILQLDQATARKRKQGVARRKALVARRKQERKAAKAAALAGAKTGLALVNDLRTKYSIAGWKVLCVRMTPGAWYDFGQLRALMPEFERGSMKAWVRQKMPRQGVIERAGNPDFYEDPNNRALIVPRYLYRLTPEAVDLAAQWRIELGEAAGEIEYP